MEDKDSVIGKLVEGSVTHITNFGAFVRIESEEGLIHISEIANEYVTNINDFVKIGDVVKVLVLARNKKNKLELSLKQAVPKETAPQSANQTQKTHAPVAEPEVYVPKKTQNSTFEDKVSKFLKRSEEKQIDVRRNLKHKQGISKKRK